MNEQKRIFATDCEGPISKNDNAFELTSHFIPEGEKFFTQISRYDDVQYDVVKRDGYKAGDTLKLIVPFLKAYEVTTKNLMDFSAKNVLLMPGAEDTLQFLRSIMPCFIISTSYEQYIRILCRILNFPFENTYCTTLNIDDYHMTNDDKKRLKQFRKEICATPLIRIPENATALTDFAERHQKIIKRLDEIFWKEIMQMKSGAMLKDINPIGGAEKANAIKNIVAKTESTSSKTMYVGDSITDVECFRLVRESGGVTISFNGNTYAVREAEISVLSTNNIIVAIIADVFNRFGRKSVLDFIDNWEKNNLKKFSVNPSLQDKLRKLFPKKLPRATRVTPINREELAAESSAFRKQVRGNKAGRLG
ncbi:MAG: HAD hydrolase family protein [Candidatus Bathyarchaeota archaeon]|nr:MAG: HAD hydrolase family protein [Candidatus Bathyarchaeota archaeon]